MEDESKTDWKKLWIFLFLLVGTSLYASPKKTVCLNMIVKNESAVIKRCLNSVRPLIDYWVIVDTGSTDGTQEIIREFLRDVPGQLYECPWINFEYNRNQALRFAKHAADYLLFIDADEQFEYSPNFTMPDLKDDAYFFDCVFSGMTYHRLLMVNNHLDWEWKGVVHEFIDCADVKSTSLFQGVKNRISTDGARSKDPQKFLKDAALLEEAVKKDPSNARYVFYLAQSYRDAGQNALALEWYKKRAMLGGFDQEMFISLYMMGVLGEALGLEESVVTKNYYRAFGYRPTRAEPLYRLASYYRRKGNYVAGHVVAAIGLTIPKSSDSLFVEYWMYDYGLLLEATACAYWLERFHECKKLSAQILERADLPERIIESCKSFLWWSEKKIEEHKLKEGGMLTQKTGS